MQGNLYNMSSNSCDLKKKKKWQTLQPSSLKGSCYPILFLSVLHTRSETVAINLWLPQERQQKPSAASESPEESWHLTCGRRLGPSPEILFSAACFPTWSWRSVRTWHGTQNKLSSFRSSFWIPVPSPKAAGELPSRKLKCPTPWYWPRTREFKHSGNPLLPHLISPIWFGEVDPFKKVTSEYGPSK